jgi:enterochelin esterase-like enzyme
MPSQYPYQNYPQQQYYTGAFNNPVNAINPQLVQSQSTAQYDPYQGGSRSADWRNRDFGTGSFQ